MCAVHSDDNVVTILPHNMFFCVFPVVGNGIILLRNKKIIIWVACSIFILILHKHYFCEVDLSLVYLSFCNFIHFAPVDSGSVLREGRHVYSCEILCIYNSIGCVVIFYSIGGYATKSLLIYPQARPKTKFGGLPCRCGADATCHLRNCPPSQETSKLTHRLWIHYNIPTP